MHAWEYINGRDGCVSVIAHGNPQVFNEVAQYWIRINVEK